MTGAAQMLTVRVPFAIRKLVVTPSWGVHLAPAHVDSTLVEALARAFRWRRMLEAGRYGTIDELSTAEKINSSYVSRVLRFTLLAPDIVEAILDRRQPEKLDLPTLTKPFATDWELQRRLWSFVRSASKDD